MSADIVAATHEYEEWLGTHIPLISKDIELKHRELAASSMRFLRGTYYWWLLRFSQQLPELLDRPVVPCVGDLHIENFGTWRDHRGARRWGVNDLDELAWGSPALDLVRLVTSASLIDGSSLKSVARLVLDVWRSATPGAATPVKKQPHLRALLPAPTSSRRYYEALAAGDADDSVPPQVAIAAQHSVHGAGWTPSWSRRSAGTGSLGHRRLVAVGRDDSKAWHAREAKQLGPASVNWLPELAHLPALDEMLYGRVQGALRGPDPNRRVAGWQIRRLAPDVTRIELAGLRRRDTKRVLTSMAQALVDVHGSDRDALDAARGRGITEAELREAVEAMRADTLAAHKAWQARKERT